MRILVCGGRTYGWAKVVEGMLPRKVVNSEHWNTMYGVLDYYYPRVTHIISGHAPGADQMAEAWADERGVPLTIFPANWQKDGRAAGPKRNQRMLDEGKPDLVIAFPGGTGTADMVSRAQHAGIEVKIVSSTA